MLIFIENVCFTIFMLGNIYNAILKLKLPTCLTVKILFNVHRKPSMDLVIWIWQSSSFIEKYVKKSVKYF